MPVIGRWKRYGPTADQSRAASGDPNFECGELIGKEFARDVDIGLVTRFGRTCTIRVLTHCLANAARCGSHREEGGAIGVCYLSGAHG